MSSFTFEVPGPPIPKQRPRRGKQGQWYTPKRTKDYEQQVAWEARAAGIKLDPDACYKLTLDLYLSTKKRDHDNILKSVMDGLDGLDGWNDRQVWGLSIQPHTVKDAGEEKAVVTLKEVDGE